jgi:DNA-binding FrmR family transcriptional regulator
MDDKTRKTISQRLNSAAGHLKGIERMVQDDAYCIDVIKQIQAVQAALDKVSTLILDNHLRTCVTTAIQGDDPEEREAVLQEVTSVFAMRTKLVVIPSDSEESLSVVSPLQRDSSAGALGPRAARAAASE